MKPTVLYHLVFLVCTWHSLVLAQEKPNNASIELGEYSGTFKNVDSTYSPMGMDLVVTNSMNGTASGHIVLYAGSCSGKKQPFSGELKAGRLEAQVKDCNDLTLSLKVQGGRLNGMMQGMRRFEVQLSR